MRPIVQIRKPSSSWVALGAILLLSLGLQGCEALSDNGTSSSGPPAELSYSKNPAKYPIGSAITKNVLSGVRLDKKFGISPSLPPGLKFDAESGDISGTPLFVTPAATYSVMASNGFGSSYTQLSIEVTDILPTISYTGLSTRVYTVGSSITQIVPTLGGGLTTSCVSVPPLPSGLSLSPECVLSGTPLVPAAATNYLISAINSGGSASIVLNLTVKDIPPVFSYPASPYAYTRGAAITSASPTSSAGAITSCSSVPTLPAGLSLSSACVISGRPSALASSQNYVITGTNSGGSAAANVSLSVQDAPPAISYPSGAHSYTRGTAVTDLIVSNTGGVIDHCTVLPTLPAGLSISDSTCAITGTPTTPTPTGTYTVTASNTGGSVSVGVTIQIKDIPPTLAYSGSPFSYIVGTSISTLTPTTGGGAIASCSSSPSLPAGLSLSTGCVLSGTPTAVSAANNYVITASNSGGSASATIRITVTENPPRFSYSSYIQSYTLNQALTPLSPTHTGGTPTSCTATPVLPAGLSLSSTCVLSGTPVALRSAIDFTITATNTGGSSSVVMNITVKDSVPSLVYSGSPFIWTKGSVIATQSPTNSGGAVTSCSVSPGLPAGLSLSSICEISGTPTAVAASTIYTISATNSGGTSTVGVDISVKDLAPVISYSGSPIIYTLGTAISDWAPSNSGGAATSCSASPSLPSGLSLSNTCVISGTPTALAAAANYTITATNSGGTSSAVVNIAVNAVAPSISYSGSPFSYTQGLAISSLVATNSGGAPVTCTSSPTLPTGLSIASNCTISGTPSVLKTSTTYTITATNTGGSATASINIKVVDFAPSIAYTGSPFTYTINSAITPFSPTSSGGAIVSCAPSPSLPAGLSLSSSCVLSGTPTALTAAANYTITATNTGGTSAATIRIAVVDLPPSIDYIPTSYHFVYTKDVAISPLTPNHSGGAITACSSSPTLPAGLSLSSTCSLTGTPTSVSSASVYTITAANTGGTSTANITITVNDAVPLISYAGAPFSWTVGTAIAAATPANAGGTISSCSVSPALPGGLNLSNSCVISGTPSSITASASYTVTATNTGGSSNATIQIAVNAPAPTLSYSGGPYLYTVGTSISTLTPSNSGGAIVSCSATPSLPAGLTLSSGCVISGTPTALQSVTTHTLTATNTGGSASTTVSITVNDGVPAISYPSSPLTWVKGSSTGSTSPASTGGTISSCSISPSLPLGLSLSNTCVLSGTPSVVSSLTTYTVTATNASGSSNATLQITVNDVAPSLGYSPGSHVFVLRTSISTVVPVNSGGSIVSCSVNPSLPDGLSLSSGCAISGTPTSLASSASYTVTATNSGGTASTQITLAVKDQAQLLFYGFAAVNGSSNGTPAGSKNVWKVSVDGVDRSVLTANTAGSLDSVFPVFNHDGSKILFASKTDQSGSSDGSSSLSYDIWTMGPTGSGKSALTANTAAGLDSDDPPRFSPDGTKIVFASRMSLDGLPNGTQTSSYNIWIMNADGSGKIALTRNSAGGLDSRNPVFSPDGGVIYFQSRTDLAASGWDGVATGSDNIWKVNSDGTGLSWLTSETDPGLDSITPSVSPDGSKIAFASKMATNVSSNSYNIWTMTAGGLSLAYRTSQTAPGRDSLSPQWSPDGSSLLFESKMPVNGSPTSSYNIWTMGWSGTNPVPLTRNNSAGLDSSSPSYSPDGLKIAFVSLIPVSGVSSSSSNLWVMNSDGTGTPTALTRNTSPGLDSSFAPLGAWYQP